MGSGKGKNRRANLTLRLRPASVSTADLASMTENNPYADGISALARFAVANGIAVKHVDGLTLAGKPIDGVFNRATRTIKLDKGLTSNDLLHTLSHELAHALTSFKKQLRQSIRSGRKSGLQEGGEKFAAKAELIADSAAMRVLRELQVDDDELYATSQQIYLRNLARLSELHVKGKSSPEEFLADTSYITQEADRVEELLLTALRNA